MLVPLVGVLGVAGSLAASFVAAQPAGAATTLFVSASGSDTNPCSAAAPCATVTQALSVAGSGDTIKVAGTIDDAVTVSITVTIEQWPGRAPAEIDATGRGTSVITVAATGNLTLGGLTITGGTSSLGAGIDSNGILTITHSTIADNTATEAAGGILDEDVLTITDSTVSDNKAGNNGGGAGGGIYIVFGDAAAITDTTVTGNSVTGGQGEAFGGGINSVGGHVTITDSTIAGNSVTGAIPDAGGLSTFGETIGATIIAGNTANGALVNCFGGGVVSLGYNLTDDATGTACGFTQGTDRVNVNPHLGSLTNNGGPTQTLLPAPTSPAVGVIASHTTLNGVAACGPDAFDQRGLARPRPGPNRNCTIGAVEVRGPPPPHDDNT